MNKISIPELCQENFDAMPRCEKGLYCGVCQKHVLDLRKKDLGTVNGILEKNPEACILVKQRHTAAVENRQVAFINHFESFLHRNKLRMLASMIIPAMLLVSGCHLQKRKNKHYHSGGRFLKQPTTDIHE